MGSINGLPSTAVTATPQTINILSPGSWYAFINEGANSIFLRTREGVLADFAGTAGALAAASFHAAEIEADDCMNVIVKNSKVDVVCGTGESAVLRMMTGQVSFKP